MHDPVDHEFAIEQEQYQENLAQVKDLDVSDADAALVAEKRRHLFAIVGIWQRHKPTLTQSPTARAM